MTNGYYVPWGVWDAEHRALAARVAIVEHAAEEERQQQSGRDAVRSNRVWLIILTVLTGVVFPILVTSLIAFLHLR